MNSTNILIIYNSKTGFSKRYAEWIGELLSSSMQHSCKLVSYEEKASIDFSSYEIIIFGGGILGGMINGIKWFKQQLPSMQNKKIIVFGVGSTPASPETLVTIQNNLTESECSQIKGFYFQGGLYYEKMGVPSRMMLAVVRKIVKSKEGENSEAYQILRHSFDASDKNAVLPLVEYVSSLV